MVTTKNPLGTRARSDRIRVQATKVPPNGIHTERSHPKERDKAMPPTITDQTAPESIKLAVALKAQLRAEILAEVQEEMAKKQAEDKAREDIRANKRNHAEIYLIPLTLITSMFFPMLFAMAGIPAMLTTPTIFFPQMTFTMIKTLRKW